MNSPNPGLVKISLPHEFDDEDFHNFDFGKLSQVDLSIKDPDKSPV
jgi:hypothetical protein